MNRRHKTQGGSRWRASTRASQKGGNPGQAMIECCIGLIALLLLVTGLIHLGKMARASLALHGQIRGEAGLSAMSSDLGVTPTAISDWDPGPDGIRFTADDKAKVSSLASPLEAVVRHSVREGDDWLAVTDKTRLPSSMVTLQNVMGMPAFLGCARESETVRIPMDPFLRKLVYDVPEVKIKEEVWMPQMGGLF